MRAIAALTAWTTLREAQVKPGDWVPAMATGGGALFYFGAAIWPSTRI